MASNTFVTIGGANFTKRQHDALVTKALLVAEDNDYCEQAEVMLNAMGFTLPPREVEVTLKVQVMLARNVKVEDLTAADFCVYDSVGKMEDVSSVAVVK
jgi:hypothetical protein